MKKLLLSLAALAMIAVGCEKNEGFDKELQSNLKSVTLKIENSVYGTKTNGETPAGTQSPCATAADLKVWFADNSGIILEERKLSAAEFVNGSYLFHQVSEQVSNIAVGRYEDGDVTPVGSTVASIIDLAEDPAAGATTPNMKRPVDEIILSSDQVALVKTEETCEEEVNGVKVEVPVYAATVTVKPRLARLEISKIQCSDLGALNEDADEDTYGFDELTLTGFTFGQNKLTAINNVVLKGQYAVKGDDGSWSVLADDATPENSVAPDNNNVWSWNLKDNQAWEQMTLGVVGDAKDWTVNNGTTSLVINSLSGEAGTSNNAYDHAEGCACGFDEDGKLTNYLANHIYNMEIVFSESHLQPRNTAICVNVTVQIADWVVIQVTPNFGN
ncbi:MAG: hypothetical protein IKK23_03875 [Bacteroidales bacterium]|nr:hypothetical protein [Bacteroidales bacterium]